MNSAKQNIDAFAWLFNLLTFFGLFGQIHFFWEDRELFKGIGDVVFGFGLFVINGGIVWKTGKWLFFSPRQIDWLLLLFFWVPLTLILLILFGFAMGSAGLGWSQ
jgi:hypothetical protein